MNQPYVFGQSGTDSPEPVLVTSPPAKIRTAVHTATNAANTGSSIAEYPGGLAGSDLCAFEGEGDVLTFLCSNRHHLRLRAQLLVPRFDRIRARREPLEREGSIGAGDGIKGVIQDADPGVHPAVHVALERNHDFLGAERVGHLHA